MAHVVTSKCLGCKFTDCVEVCPVACFYEVDKQVMIHAEDCIDCTACVAECPVEAIYAELRLTGVHVLTVCPGPIDTMLMHELHRGINPLEPDAVKAFNVGRNPMGRYGDPTEVAKVVVFLASDGASYVNGAAWVIDGGRTAI